jgi:hypothetical protein
MPKMEKAHGQENTDRGYPFPATHSPLCSMSLATNAVQYACTTITLNGQ